MSLRRSTSALRALLLTIASFSVGTMVVVALLAAAFLVVIFNLNKEDVTSTRLVRPAPPMTTPKEEERLEAAPGDRLVREEIRIEKPEVLLDGTMQSELGSIILFEIPRFTSRDVCTHSDGQRWACGLQAYATLRNTTVGQTVICHPRYKDADALVASCRLGSHNVLWPLLRAGLARLRDDVDETDLLKAQDYARERHLGLWK